MLKLGEHALRRHRMEILVFLLFVSIMVLPPRIATAPQNTADTRAFTAQVVDVGFPGHFKIETNRRDVFKVGDRVLLYSVVEIKGNDKKLPLSMKAGPFASGKVYKAYDYTILDVEIEPITVKLQPGESLYVESAVGTDVPRLSPYPIPRGGLTLSAGQGVAAISLDGYEVGEVRADRKLELSQVPAGKHTLTARINGREAWRDSVEIQASVEITALIPDSAYLEPFALEPETVSLGGGSFAMGSDKGMDEEKPVQRIAVEPFLIGKFEITNAEFDAFVSETKYRTDAEQLGSSKVLIESDWQAIKGADWKHPGGPTTNITGKERFPVVHVSWNDSLQYSKWLAKKTTKPYRLPTEAEWEYACRAGTITEFWWGDSFDRTKANCASYRAGFDVNDFESWKRWRIAEKSAYFLTAVGSFPRNPWGVFDTIGNVWEWCSTQYKEYPYSATDGRETINTSQTVVRVLRGGSWRWDDGAPRAARRGQAPANLSFDTCGFRIAADKGSGR